MELLDRLNLLANKYVELSSTIQTEEATKNAFIMPFLNSVLGYDVFDPKEVVPEYVCDIGTKRGEKIDYAIFKDGEVQILVECKKCGEDLNVSHANQLFRYFHVTNARIAVLTNGQHYWFFTDLDAPNKMDEKPFLVLDLKNIDEHNIPELIKLTKQNFNLESVISAAGELKYIGQLKRILNTQLSEPSEDFVRFFASKVYEGVLTQKVREQFAGLLAKAIDQHLNDRLNDRLKSAIKQPNQVNALSSDNVIAASDVAAITDVSDNESQKVVTTEEEMEAFFVVKSILRTELEVSRIHHRDSQSYLAVLVDDNNRKTVCRLHLNRSAKYIGLMDAEKNETRHPISNVDDIYKYSSQLVETAKRFV